MSKVTKKQLAKAFREARPYIEDHSDSYICCAIAEVWAAGKISKKVSYAATNLIAERMNQKVFLESWLYQNSPEFQDWYDLADREEQFKQMRLYRLRWLDALIEEFGKK